MQRSQPQSRCREKASQSPNRVMSQGANTIAQAPLRSDDVLEEMIERLNDRRAGIAAAAMAGINWSIH